MRPAIGVPSVRRPISAEAVVAFARTRTHGVRQTWWVAALGATRWGAGAGAGAATGALDAHA